ncbi:MAG: hypothetical protein ACYCT9_12840 [Leptospirillum sp.]
MRKISLMVSITLVMSISSVAYAGQPSHGGITVNASISTDPKGDSASKFMTSRNIMVPDKGDPNGGTFQKEEEEYHYRRICGNAGYDLTKDLLIDRIRVKNTGTNQYLIESRIDRLAGYRTEDQSWTIPGSDFLEMCQVVTIRIVTKRQLWRIKTQHKMIDFQERLNGKTLMVKTVAIIPAF